MSQYMYMYLYYCSYLAVAIDVSKKSPELIQLLDMHVHFAADTPGRKVMTSKYVCDFNFKVAQDDVIKAPVTKCDSGTQTDTHFMESNIVRSYEWNEWELRRKAIKLVHQLILLYNNTTIIITIGKFTSKMHSFYSNRFESFQKRKHNTSLLTKVFSI